MVCSPQLYPFGCLWEQHGLGTFAVMASMTGVAMMAIGWMIASFLNDERLKAWAKTEIMKIGFAIILVVCAYVLFSSGVVENALFALTKMTVNPAADDEWLRHHLLVCGDPGTGSNAAAVPLSPPCHIRLALDYLETIYQTGKNLNMENYVSYANLAFLVNLGLNFRGFLDFWTSANLNPFVALSIFMDTVAIAFDLVIKVMMAVRFLEFLVDLTSAVLFPTLIVLGIVLRIFFFSRKLGGILVALALALYIVLPMYFAMMDYVMVKMAGTPADKVVFKGNVDARLTPTAGVSGGRESLADIKTRMDRSRSTYYNPDGSVKQMVIDIDLCATDQNSNPSNDWLQLLDNSKSDILDAFGGGTSSVFALGWLGLRNSWIPGVGWKDKVMSREVADDPLLGFNGMLDNVAKLIVYGMLVPFIGLMIMLASIKVFSPLIGGDVEIAGISRLL